LLTAGARIRIQKKDEEKVVVSKFNKKKNKYIKLM
jgi:hypothetical protein